MSKQKREKERRQMNYTSSKESAQARESASKGSNSCIVLPKGKRAEFFPLKKGIYKIDILPYLVGKGNPFAKEGSYHFERTYYYHAQVGAGKDMVVCLRKTIGKPCPICDYRAKASQDEDADEKLLKSLLPKARQVFNIIDLGNPDAGVKLMDVSPYNFGELLDQKLSTAEEDDEYEKFFHLDGLTLRIGVKEETFSNTKFGRCKDIEFRVRQEPYEEDILDQVFCLDSILNILPYKELQEKFLEAGPADDSKKKSTKGKAKGRPADDDDEDDDDDDEPVKKKGKKPVDDDDEDDDDDDLVDDDDDDDDDEPAPKKGKGATQKASTGKSKSKTPPPEDDDDDDDEDDDDLVDDDDDDDDSSDDSDDDDDDDSSDDDDSDDDDDSSDDDDDDDDDSSDDDDDDDDDEPAPKKKAYVPKKGDIVSFEYKDKTHTGKVVELNTKRGHCHVKCERPDPHIVGMDEVRLAKGKPDTKKTGESSSKPASTGKKKVK